MQTSNTWWPILTHKTLACVASLCLHSSWPRGEESRFTASFYATLDAITDLSACRLVLFSAAADANNMNNAFFLYLSDIFASIPEIKPVISHAIQYQCVYTIQ